MILRLTKRILFPKFFLINKKERKHMENTSSSHNLFQRGLVIGIVLLIIGLLVWAFWGKSNSEQNATDMIRPTFDTVRIEKGKAVIAGRGEPDTAIHIVSGDTEIGTEITDTRGEFVFLPEKKFTAGTYELTLFCMSGDTKIESPHKAVLTVDPKTDEAVAILIETDHAKLLSSPKREKGAGATGITMIEYDFKEKFNMTGYGTADHTARFYLNNEFIGEVLVDKNGWWTYTGHKKLIQDKTYTLRIDLLNQTNKVVARSENKFSTDVYTGEPELYAVKKGDCLWTIAKRKLGRGIDYVLIFKANKAQIRDPDLIYPNQLFKIPQK